MAEQQSGSQRRHWIFCSSGARPLYLENVVRALALPSGEPIKYRYEASLVSKTFRDLTGTATPFEATPVTGDIAYLCYLDNRKKGTPPKVYPVRDATIESVTVLGSTFVIQMTARCFIQWPENEKLDELVAKFALDPLPYWVSDPSGDPEKSKAAGCWLAQTNPLPDRLFHRYAEHGRPHIEAFESAARAITTGTDFADGKRMFATITGLYDSKTRDSVGAEALRAGRSYDLYVYHFQPGDGTHSPLENFRLLVSSDNPDVTVVGAAERHVEARYDEVVFTFRVADEAKDGPVNLGLNVTRIETGQTEPVYILRSLLRRRVKSARLRKLFFAAVIGIGLFGSQAVTLIATGKATGKATDMPVLIAVLVLSLLAGWGAAFQFKTKV